MLLYVRIEHRFVGADIKRLRISVLLRLADMSLFMSDELRDFGQRVVKIAENQSFFRTNNHASRLQTNIQTVTAKIAFSRGAVFRINVNRIIGAGSDTGFATDANIFIKLDYTVRS